MNTEAFLTRKFSPAVAGWQPRELDAGWFGPSRHLTLDARDLGIVAFTFAFVAAVVLTGAVLVDASLLAVILRGVSAIGDVAGYRLALDLLPWACVFTATTSFLALAGLRASASLRHRRRAVVGSGFQC